MSVVTSMTILKKELTAKSKSDLRKIGSKCFSNRYESLHMLLYLYIMLNVLEKLILQYNSKWNSQRGWKRWSNSNITNWIGLANCDRNNQDSL
jgi:hypothetical protein